MSSSAPKRFKSKAEKRKFLRARSKERRLEKDALGNLRADNAAWLDQRNPITLRGISQGGAPQ